MRFFISLLILILLASIIVYPSIWKDIPYAKNFVYQSACSKPIDYAIGRIDPRFGLSNNDVLRVSEKAASIWNLAVGKNIFMYNPQAKLSINMDYDQRQYLTTQANQLENQVKNDQKSLDDDIVKFKKESAIFEKKLADFNKKVDFWNSQGGAPQEEFDSLTNEQQELKKEANRLNQEAQRLNISNARYNEQIGVFNQTIRSLEVALEQKPEEGVFDSNSNTITVFFNNNEQELIRTIAHELGHARGLAHSTNPRAIMYPKTTAYLSPTQDETADLAEICLPRPFTEFLISYVRSYFRRPVESTK